LISSYIIKNLKEIPLRRHYHSDTAEIVDWTIRFSLQTMYVFLIWK